MGKWDKLQSIHLDVLKEIGNIGAGNAATSLSQMMGVKIEIDVPEASIISVKELIEMIGNEEDLVVCINLDVTGDAPSIVFFIIKAESALQLVNRLLGLPLNSKQEIDDIAQSVLQEVGNILTGSILNAISSITGLFMQPSVPAYAFDMLGAVLSAALLERGCFEDEVLVIKTRYYDPEVVVDGYFFMLPQEVSLDKIFNSVGIAI